MWFLVSDIWHARCGKDVIELYSMMAGYVANAPANDANDAEDCVRHMQGIASAVQVPCPLMITTHDNNANVATV